jgi:chemotaxis regulatin CheY-phosphate phosphatase CheZ
MTTNPNNKPDNDAHPEQIFDAMSTVSSQLQMIEKFIARRFDEISMEINATSQQVDMAENGIANRFGEILEVMKAVSYSGDGTTAANTGVELDAVVETTAAAANRIMDAAERINGFVAAAREAKDDASRAAAFEGIENDVSEIFMACSFQDITGQRVRNTLDNLKLVEERLSTALDKMGIKVDVKAEDHIAIKSTQSSQDDIDSLF